VNKTRPKNLNLFTIQFPIPSIVSFLHRATGAFLFLLIPFVLWLFAYSLTDSGFQASKQALSVGYVKFIFWLFFIPLCFHLIAGIRHLLADMHFGDTLKLGRAMSFLTFIVTAIFVVLAGIWLW
jgi:succinate dehydrogenase / fumarate reductase cytochrome b subunit